MAVKLCFGACKGLPPNKKSIFGNFTIRTIIALFMFFNAFIDIASTNEEISCTNVSNTFAAKEMLSMVDIKSQPDSDIGGLCSNRGCCGASALPQLQARARAQLDGTLRSELGKLADILANRAQRFDEFFRRLLRESREEFHAMFKRTYGMIYEQHSYVFERLFERLERYYARGDADLLDTMDDFFGVLYQKMFTVLNSQYDFDDKYLKCVSEHMRDTQPFEDVPHKLSVQLRRAFVATRTFHKALRAGADVVRAMQQIGVSPSCGAWWARLRWCGACAGAGVPACGRYCHNVLRACLAHHADIEQHWDAYVDAVEKVADRLLGPFNIVMVVEPIDIKISEAIMNFQEHNQEISQKIFAGCGKPVLGGSGSAGPFFAPDRTRRSSRYARSAPGADWRPDADDVDDFEIEASYESVLNRHPQLLQSAEDMPQTTARFAAQAEARGRFLRYMRGEIDSGELESEERDRRRRDADPGPVPAAEPSPASSEIDFKPYEFEGSRGGARKKNNKKSNPSKNGDTSSWGGPALEGLVREARARVRNSRRYWPQLAYVVCAGDAAPPTPNAPCFNGTHVASYTAERAGVGTAALASNPEVRWAGSAAVVGEPDAAGQPARAAAAAVSAQQEALRTLTAKLKDAYNGVEVQWRDDDDLSAASLNMDLVEAAGSGSGSGDDMDLTDDDEDRTPSPYYPGAAEGSGGGPPDDDQEPDTNEDEEEPARPPDTQTPFTPDVLNAGIAKTKLLPDAPRDRDRDQDHGAAVDVLEPDDNLPEDTKERSETPKAPPAVPPAGPTSERGVPGAANRPSLERALLAYALPVVCAWFGTIVTELF